MKRGINFWEAFFLGLLLLKLHGSNYQPSWLEVFLPLFFLLLGPVVEFFADRYSWAERFRLWLWKRMVKRETDKAIKKGNPGNFYEHGK